MVDILIHDIDTGLSLKKSRIFRVNLQGTIYKSIEEFAAALIASLPELSPSKLQYHKVQKKVVYNTNQDTVRIHGQKLQLEKLLISEITLGTCTVEVAYETPLFRPFLFIFVCLGLLCGLMPGIIIYYIFKEPDSDSVQKVLPAQERFSIILDSVCKGNLPTVPDQVANNTTETLQLPQESRSYPKNSPNDEKLCSKCHASFPISHTFCGNCGERVNNSPMLPQKPTVTSVNNSSDRFSTRLKKPIDNKVHNNISIWNPTVAANWSLLLSPVFGAYLHYRNWLVIGEQNKSHAAKSWIAVTLLVFTVTQFLYIAEKIEAHSLFSVNFFITASWWFLVGRSQARYVNVNFGKDYLRRPWTLAIITGFCVSFIYLLIIFAISSSFPEKESKHTLSSFHNEAGLVPLKSSPTQVIAVRTDSPKVIDNNIQVTSNPPQNADYNNKDVYRFEDFPSVSIYHGSAAKLILNSDFASKFRSRLSEALQTQKPEFAGEYVAARWGCGSQCGVTAFVNKRTGQVLEKTFGGEFSIDERFKVDSKLIIEKKRELNEDFDEIGQSVSYYVLERGRLKLLKKLMIGSNSESKFVDQQRTNDSETTYKTSFNCYGSLTNVEKLICSNPSIASLDLELSQKFDLLKSNQAYVFSQREWVRERNKCEDVLCLENVYRKRLFALQNNTAAFHNNHSFEAGRDLANKFKYREAYNIWMSLAQSGDPKSQMGLAKLYLRGDGVEKDYKQGFYWTQKSAEQNNAEAQHYLGMLYKNGDGTDMDLKKSEFWFRKAEENGYRVKR